MPKLGTSEKRVTFLRHVFFYIIRFENIIQIEEKPLKLEQLINRIVHQFELPLPSFDFL